MLTITNAFSINMIAHHVDANVSFKRITTERVRDLVNASRPVVGRCGHKDIATLVNKKLKADIAHERVDTKLEYNDLLIVAQYRGPRLPEGATELPKDAVIEWYEVLIV